MENAWQRCTPDGARLGFWLLALTALGGIAMPLLAQPTSAPAPASAPSRVEKGELNGAAWRVEIPAAWNGELVMSLHGYDPVDGKPFPIEGRFHTAFRELFVQRGYAYAQSQYASEGWAIKEALEDNEALRRLFVAQFGQPRRTWVVGQSMGGLLTELTLERYPEIYSGGVAYCPVLAPALDFFEHGLYDLLVAFDFLIGRETALPPLADPQAPRVDPQALGAAIAARPDLASLLAAQFQLRPSDLANTVLFYQLIWQELSQRAGGSPIDNRDTVYAGFGDDIAFNRQVRRQAADPAARLYVERYATPTGRLEDPLLALHTSYDPVVPPRWPSRFATQVDLAGRSHLYQVNWVARDGHCPFTPAESWATFQRLLDWVASGQKPPIGELQAQ